MRDEPRKPHLNHETPHWIQGAPDYFITICTLPRGVNQLCLPTVGPVIIDSIAHYNRNEKWFCSLALLMPDHVHFLLNFSPEIPSFARVVGNWKQWVTNNCGISWQENFFDHRIRNDDNGRWKSEYIWQNPVRAGLVEKAEDWPYKWTPEAY